jgi:hypothetical protein
MDTAQKPLDTMKFWQDWYCEHEMVTSMDKSEITKENRENLHDTSNAVNQLYSDIQTKAIKKATACFSDIISEYSCELSGPQLYKCFYAAAAENFNHADKEYKKAKQLMNLLQYKSEN